MRVFPDRLSICVCVSFRFGIEGGMWDLTVSIPDHCFSFKWHEDTLPGVILLPLRIYAYLKYCM